MDPRIDEFGKGSIKAEPNSWKWNVQGEVPTDLKDNFTIFFMAWPFLCKAFSFQSTLFFRTCATQHSPKEVSLQPRFSPRTSARVRHLLVTALYPVPEISNPPFKLPKCEIQWYKMVQMSDRQNAVQQNPVL